MFPKPELGVSLAGLAPVASAPWAGGPRAGIQWAADAGFRSVQLDAAAPGLRPRELDRAARRDVAALLRRLQLRLSGLDLWIPPEHLTDPARSERALEAITQAVELAADLARLGATGVTGVVSVVLAGGLAADARGQLASHAESHGAWIADHAVPGPGGFAAWAAESGIGVGLDPAAILLGGQDPAALAARAGPALRSARLSDATMTGRAAPGLSSGRLDMLAYAAALAVAGYTRGVVLDLRGLADQAQAAAAARDRWS